MLTLPLAMQGQTIKRYESDGWWNALTQGTIIRTYDLVEECNMGNIGPETLQRGFVLKRVGRHYMRFDEGIGNLVTFDYVNGYNYGPDMTFGYVSADNSRMELATELRYSDRRNRWSGELEFTYTFPPEYYSWVTLFGRRKTIDYDNYAYTSFGNNSMASTLAGWNGYKLYEAQQIGVKGSTAVSGDFQIEGAVWHEKRWQLENHRQRNLFRVKGEDNLPRLRGIDLSDSRMQWGQQKLWRADAALEYTPNRRIVCYNDLRTETLTGNPTFRLGAQSGWGDIKYLAIDLSVKQEIGDDRQCFRYYVDAGFYPVGQHEIWVIDMHHFDATHMAYQRKDNLIWFSLLSNYEMSSPNSWAEAHAEWSSCKMLLTRFVDDSALKEYVQLHIATVEDYHSHTELSYGFDLSGLMRIGCSLGFDGTNFDGIGLNLVFSEPTFGK